MNYFPFFLFRLLHDKRQAADAIELLKLLGKKYPYKQQATNTTEGYSNTATIATTKRTRATTINAPKISDTQTTTTTTSSTIAVSAIKAKDAFNQANDTISTNLLFSDALNASTCQKTSYTGNNEPKYGLMNDNDNKDNQKLDVSQSGVMDNANEDDEVSIDDVDKNNESCQNNPCNNTLDKQDRKRRRL